MGKRSGAERTSRMPARYFALLCDALRADGMDVDALLRAARLRPTQIYGADAGLSLRQFEALAAEAARLSGRSDLGFLLGRQIKLSSHEILGYGIITSPTLDYALSLAARYYRLMTPWFRMRYRRGPRISEVSFQPAVQLAPAPMQFLLETVIISAHEQFRSLVQGPLPAYDVYVSYAEPQHVRHYRELRPARFHFGAENLPGARMVLDTALLAQPLPMADRAALKMAEERCEDLLRRTAWSAGMTGWVTMMLRESHEGLPTLAELAHLLNQSPRTLDRHLHREGSRFLQLSKRVRYERACELLGSGLSVTQVAYQVGYRDPANFSRAFRRDSGKSPGEYARSARAATVSAQAIALCRIANPPMPAAAA
ncbi:MAG: AraC family transcriptional regulator ligand-binding domain-containing protein [Nevskia sp.]|nr:AraC family transcriptional regulator ligand-binding domain-containing protein [Nevskia sp.]